MGMDMDMDMDMDMSGLGMRQAYYSAPLAVVLVRRSSPCSREAMARICGGGRLLPPHCVPMVCYLGYHVRGAISSAS